MSECKLVPNLQKQKSVYLVFSMSVVLIAKASSSFVLWATKPYSILTQPCSSANWVLPIVVH